MSIKVYEEIHYCKNLKYMNYCQNIQRIYKRTRHNYELQKHLINHESKGYNHVIGVIVMWRCYQNVSIGLMTVYDITYTQKYERVHQVDFQLMPLTFIKIINLFPSIIYKG
ncbi:hypothetical protein NARC_130055 [Candidatus Nitrosocosmicus arcticus]|uniref:Uncharacterized protein n=1 Tax=Candidatus Nitrosocosmicus arcticus TaxID=2035267 RepID=A0A557SSX0_9ARCH|nr:hypothetical protein NARC_130055 [Candidatus Nitrosocosmicus arcticus]